jgi:hypothetical protein
LEEPVVSIFRVRRLFFLKMEAVSNVNKSCTFFEGPLKVRVKFSLSLMKHNAKKTYWGGGGGGYWYLRHNIASGWR